MRKFIFIYLFAEWSVHRHHYYRLKGEYSVQSTPRNWFEPGATGDGIMRNAYQTINPPKAQTEAPPPGRKTKKRLILSPTMAIDIDPRKVSSVLVCHFYTHYFSPCSEATRWSRLSCTTLGAISGRTALVSVTTAAHRYRYPLAAPESQYGCPTHRPLTRSRLRNHRR